MLCFNKITGEYNTKKYFKKFSFCGSIFNNVELHSHRDHLIISKVLVQQFLMKSFLNGLTINFIYSNRFGQYLIDNADGVTT